MIDMEKKGTRTSARDGLTDKRNQAETTEVVYTPGVEIKILIAVVFLLAYGLIMIFSASSYACANSSACNYNPAFYFTKQLKVIIFSFVILGITSLIPYNLYKKFAVFFYVFALGLIFLLYTPLAVESHDATRWIQIKGVQIQIADIWRICLLIFMAYYIGKFKKNIKKNDLNGMLTIGALWMLMGVQAFLLLKISSNLSSALILMIICFILTWVVSRNTIPHAVVMGVGITGFICLVRWLKTHLPDPTEIGKYKYQVQRLFAWMDPNKYADDQGYQTLQSLYAIGSGGLLGKGLGNGTQKLEKLPEPHNDMIFSVICEELGLVGAIILFFMYGYLLYQMYIVVKESRNIYASSLVLGVMLHILTQIIVNVCVTVNLFPNTGVSLPLISYGGTAILFTLIEIGLVVGVRRQQVRRRYSRIQ